MSHMTNVGHQEIISRIQKQKETHFCYSVSPLFFDFPVISPFLQIVTGRHIFSHFKPPKSCCINLFVFLLGVAEQFAIAEAKLRAWASMDDEDSNDEDSLTNGQTRTSFSQSSGIQPFCSIPSHVTHRLHFCIITEKISLHLSNHPTPTPNYPFISRCSDFLLLPQTPPRPILSQERHASLRLTAARHRPPTAPWAPAAAAACSVVGRLLTMTHIHPRPIHLFYPTTA